MVVAAMRRDMGIFNDPPTISTVADQVVSTNMSTGPIPFIIGDPNTAVDSLNVTVSSSNTNLVPANSIFLSGTGTNRTVTITPTGSLGGSAVITLFVMDGEWATPTSFTVSIGNGAPTAYHWLVGNGTWDTVTPNWWGLGTLWPNSGSDKAIIGGPSGTINLAPGMMANSVTFNSSATIQSNTLTLSGTTPDLSAQGGATGVVATVVGGSAGLTKLGAGTVVLSRTNTYTGVTTIKDGVLQLGDGVADGALAGSTSIVASNNGVFALNLQATRALSQTVSGNGGLLEEWPGHADAFECQHLHRADHGQRRHLGHQQQPLEFSPHHRFRRGAGIEHRHRREELRFDGLLRLRHTPKIRRESGVLGNYCRDVCARFERLD